MEQNINFLKRVLSVPTKTYKEDLMIQFLTEWLVENNIPYFVDKMGNVYATKQTDEVEYFPCVVAHTDFSLPLRDPGQGGAVPPRQHHQEL